MCVSPKHYGGHCIWVCKIKQRTKHLCLIFFICQTVCYGGPKHPCYKIAYFQDMSSRVAFKEAKNACEIDGGTLLSIENETEQKLIEKLLHDLTSSGSGVSDGDFWIDLTRNGDGGAQTTFAACSELYKWTDGSVSEFR
uniref:C-type lectin domain-containing protein n=1 Tax=Erpetoichthys calabaricus TaxID=27687 RepID=A0A8C4RQL4_ERPCA